LGSWSRRSGRACAWHVLRSRSAIKSILQCTLLNLVRHFIPASAATINPCPSMIVPFGSIHIYMHGRGCNDIPIYVNSSVVNQADSIGLLGMGIGVGGAGGGEIGDTAGGYGTGSVSVGGFVGGTTWWNPFTWNFSGGIIGTGGIGYYGPDGGNQNPQGQCKLYALGANLGLGRNLFITDADNPDDLTALAVNDEYDLGLVSVTLTVGTNSLGEPVTTLGVGGTLGFGHFTYPTGTVKFWGLSS
jgi:hypothetical protein